MDLKWSSKQWYGNHQRVNISYSVGHKTALRTHADDPMFDELLLAYVFGGVVGFYIWVE